MVDFQMKLLSKTNMLSKNKLGAYSTKQIAIWVRARNISTMELENKAGVKIHVVRNILRGKFKDPSIETQRKAETRTKIKLGRVLIKSGLTEVFSISPGADLQLDDEIREKATFLLGALIDMHQNIVSTPHNASQKEEWEILGRSAFVTHYLSTTKREKEGYKSNECKK